MIQELDFSMWWSLASYTVEYLSDELTTNLGRNQNHIKHYRMNGVYVMNIWVDFVVDRPKP